jgi:hypothetical protein
MVKLRHRDSNETRVLYTMVGGIRCGGASASVREWGSKFGSGGRFFCEETERASCGPLIAKTLPDCLPLHLLCPAVV